MLNNAAAGPGRLPHARTPRGAPTDQAECTAEQAYEWTQGRALFAAGSPFGAVEYNGQRLEPGQANNAYVFPGIGLALVAAHAREVPDQVFHIAARTLAQQVQSSDLDVRRLYPPLSDIRSVSKIGRRGGRTHS